MKTDFIRLLRCPYCGNIFRYHYYGIDRFQNAYSVLECRCAEFPVIADIPILKIGTLGNWGESAGDLVDLIKHNKFEEALLSQIIAMPVIPNLTPKVLRRTSRETLMFLINKAVHKIMLPRWKKERTKLFTEICQNSSVKDMLMFYFKGDGFFRKDAFDYFFYRFSQPRHLTCLGFLQAIKKDSGPIIELACGFGHMTHEIIKWANGSLVVGIDHCFFPLYVARKLISPEAQYICYDASNALPFEDNVFYAAMVIDGIHYIDHKPLVIREMKRVLLKKGILMLICSRNANVNYIHAGSPLTPDGYSRLIGTMNHRILPDSEVINCYISRKGPDLDCQIPFEILENEPLVSIIASDEESVFRKYPSFNKWPHGEGSLNINPLYRCVNNNDNNMALLQRHFPSEFYENDNDLSKMYLPEKICVDKNISSFLGNEQNIFFDEKMIEQFIILNLPQNYCHFEEENEFIEKIENKRVSNGM